MLAYTGLRFVLYRRKSSKFCSKIHIEYPLSLDYHNSYKYHFKTYIEGTFLNFISENQLNTHYYFYFLKLLIKREDQPLAGPLSCRITLLNPQTCKWKSYLPLKITFPFISSPLRVSMTLIPKITARYQTLLRKVFATQLRLLCKNPFTKVRLLCKTPFM